MRSPSLVALLGLFSSAAAGDFALRGGDRNITTSAFVSASVNARGIDGDKQMGAVTLTVGPGYENQKISMGGPYMSGRVEVFVKSAAVAPGIITSVYATTGGGRTGLGGGNGTAGTQDEIDLEWKGNDPTQVQTNVFLSGQEDLMMVAIGGDGSAAEHAYAWEWDATSVKFWVNGVRVRTVALSRPLLPMELYYSVWTTSGGWPGLINWAGDMNWNARGGQPASATFRTVASP